VIRHWSFSWSASSPAGIVELLDDLEVSAKKIRSAVTDTGREIRYDSEVKPGISNLPTIYSALTDRKVGELESDYAGKGYGDLKKDLAEVVAQFVEPLRERVRTYRDTRPSWTGCSPAAPPGRVRSRAPRSPSSTRGSVSSRRRQRFVIPWFRMLGTRIRGRRVLFASCTDVGTI
jgi:hypothetical protein